MGRLDADSLRGTAIRGAPDPAISGPGQPSGGAVARRLPPGARVGRCALRSHRQGHLPDRRRRRDRGIGLRCDRDGRLSRTSAASALRPPATGRSIGTAPAHTWEFYIESSIILPMAKPPLSMKPTGWFQVAWSDEIKPGDVRA